MTASAEEFFRDHIPLAGILPTELVFLDLTLMYSPGSYHTRLSSFSFSVTNFLLQTDLSSQMKNCALSFNVPSAFA